MALISRTVRFCKALDVDRGRVVDRDEPIKRSFTKNIIRKILFFSYFNQLKFTM